VTQIWAATFSSLRKVFAIERLGPPAPAAAKRRGRGFARMLLALEPLPRDATESPRRRRSWLRLLLAIEPLERAPAPPPRPRRSRWLRWLFAPEPLDPP
jgi:hypothetical protein